MKKREKIKLIDGLLICKGIFVVDDGIDYEDIGVAIDNIPTELIELRFFVDEVESYNESTEESTMIRMKSGDAFEIEISINEFDKTILNYLKTKNNGKEI